MLKYIIIICLFLNGCTAYKNNQLQKQIIKKQQSWLNIQYLAMKKPQLTNKKGTMQTHKKYQYKYLIEKVFSLYHKILIVGQIRKLTKKMSIKDAPTEYEEKQYSYKQLKKLGVV